MNRTRTLGLVSLLAGALGACGSETLDPIDHDGVSSKSGSTTGSGGSTSSSASGGGGSSCDCTTPPAPACTSPVTLTTYANVCDAGVCVLDHTDMTCPGACVSGGCSAVAQNQLAVGGAHVCVITAAGGVKCWGSNEYGQLGNDSSVDSSVAVDVVGLDSGVIAVSADVDHSCALTVKGAVKCWGFNAFGQLGDGTETDSLIPVDVSGLSSGVKAVNLGYSNSCVVKANGGVQCWGLNDHGQLGNGTITKSSIPVDVLGLTGAVALAGCFRMSCALTSNGSIQCWGEYANHPDNGMDALTPVAVPLPGAGAFASVIAAHDFGQMCTITSTGSLKCLGDNAFGQLGNGSTDYKDFFVDAIVLGEPAKAVGMGFDYVCALGASGTVKCWGTNAQGQLGNGMLTNSVVAVGVSDLPNDVEAIASSVASTCVRRASGAVKCWGSNDHGRLGNGSTMDSSVPVDVIGL